jgi:nucleoside-diphosphate-sugar epimerase
MRILITGARGNFPTGLIRRLEAAEHELVLFDIEPIPSEEQQAFQADIRDAGAVATAVRGCDAVIHAAALHGELGARRNYDDHYGINVTGTHNILLAMVRQGVENLVFSSSDAVFGNGMKGRRVMDEHVPCIPNNIESLTKVLGEEMCMYYARQHTLRVAILRYGHFQPADWRASGIGRLTNWLDREDVAQANELALGAVKAEEFKCEAFLIHCHKPFVDSDWPDLAENPEPIVESYWPGAAELLARHNLRIPKIHTRYDISKAQSVLGFEPEHNFDQFLKRLKRASAEGQAFGIRH